MNLLKGYGSVIYGLTTFAALLCALLISLILLMGFAYAGVMGDAPGDPAYQRYAVVAATGFFGTAILFIGLLGVSSHPRLFPALTIIGTALLLVIVVPYAVKGLRGAPLLWTSLLISIELATLVLSCLKIKQLSRSRSNLAKQVRSL